MGLQIPQNTAFNRAIYLGATGLAPTVLISKDGGSFNALAGSFSEISNGWYLMALSSSDTDTLGALAYFLNAGSGLPDTWLDQVVSGGGGDPWATALPGSYSAGQAGYLLGTYLDAAVSSRSTYAGADTSGTTTLLSRIGGSITISGGKVAATLAATDVTGNVACDLQTIKTQAVTCSAGVTVGAFVGNGTHVITVDSSGNVATSVITTAAIDSILDRSNGGETGYTLRQAMHLLLAALCGKLTTGGGTATFRDVNDTADRITATVPSAGNRSGITLNP